MRHAADVRAFLEGAKPTTNPAASAALPATRDLRVRTFMRDGKGRPYNTMEVWGRQPAQGEPRKVLSVVWGDAEEMARRAERLTLDVMSKRIRAFGEPTAVVDAWLADSPTQRAQTGRAVGFVRNRLSLLYGVHTAWPWVQRPCRALTSDGAVDLSADGPRALLRRVRRHLRRATNTATAMETP